jgi:hypothetical protein
MKNIENFYKKISVVIIAATFAIENLIVKRLVEYLQKIKLANEWIILLLSIIILVFIFELLSLVVEMVIEKCKCIRALILGEDFIEGVWFDLVEDNGEKCYGLVTISYKEGHIEQNGVKISSQGLPQSAWNTDISKYEDNILTIVYRVNYSDEKMIEHPSGISFIHFLKRANHKHPLIYNGTFYDMSKPLITKSFNGFKVTDNKILSQLDISDTRMEAIKTLMNHPCLEGIKS